MISLNLTCSCHDINEKISELALNNNHSPNNSNHLKKLLSIFHILAYSKQYHLHKRCQFLNFLIDLLGTFCIHNFLYKICFHITPLGMVSIPNTTESIQSKIVAELLPWIVLCTIVCFYCRSNIHNSYYQIEFSHQMQCPLCVKKNLKIPEG